MRPLFAALFLTACGTDTDTVVRGACRLDPSTVRLTLDCAARCAGPMEAACDGVRYDGYSVSVSFVASYPTSAACPQTCETVTLDCPVANAPFAAGASVWISQTNGWASGVAYDTAGSSDLTLEDCAAPAE